MTEKKTIAFPVGPAPKPIPRACSDVFRLWAALGLGILLSLAFFILQDLYQEMGFRKQLTPGSVGECVHSDRHELVVGGTKLDTCVDPAVLAAQPLPVEEMGAPELRPEPRSAQPFDRVAIRALGGLALVEQGP